MSLANDVVQSNERAMLQIHILMFNFNKSYYFHDSISFNSKENGPTVE